jgi:hypothetical protein
LASPGETLTGERKILRFCSPLHLQLGLLSLCCARKCIAMAARRVICSATTCPTMEHSSRVDDLRRPLGQWEIKPFVILDCDPATRAG